MISNNLHAVEITVHRDRYGDGWSAKLTWQDDRFCQSQTVQGSISTRYYEKSLSRAVDAVVEVAKRFGLSLGIETLPLGLYYLEDGLSDRFPPPDGWKELLNEEANRRGWRAYQNSGVVSS